MMSSASSVRVGADSSPAVLSAARFSAAPNWAALFGRVPYQRSWLPGPPVRYELKYTASSPSAGVGPQLSLFGASIGPGITVGVANADQVHVASPPLAFVPPSPSGAKLRRPHATHATSASRHIF